MNLTLDRHLAIRHFTGIHLRKKYNDPATRNAAREKVCGVVTYVRKAEVDRG